MCNVTMLQTVQPHFLGTPTFYHISPSNSYLSQCGKLKNYVISVISTFMCGRADVLAGLLCNRELPDEPTSFLDSGGRDGWSVLVFRNVLLLISYLTSYVMNIPIQLHETNV